MTQVGASLGGIFEAAQVEAPTDPTMAGLVVRCEHCGVNIGRIRHGDTLRAITTETLDHMRGHRRSDALLELGAALRIYDQGIDAAREHMLVNAARQLLDVEEGP